MLLKGNQFDKALNQRLNLKAAILPNSLKFHHDLDQSSHAQQKECSKDLKIVNAALVVESARPNKI